MAWIGLCLDVLRKCKGAVDVLQLFPLHGDEFEGQDRQEDLEGLLLYF
jgi:hypothetical protein